VAILLVGIVVFLLGLFMAIQLMAIGSYFIGAIGDY